MWIKRFHTGRLDLILVHIVLIFFLIFFVLQSEAFRYISLDEDWEKNFYIYPSPSLVAQLIRSLHTFLDERIGQTRSRSLGFSSVNQHTIVD